MSSPSPLLYNTYYHIYNRGVNGGNIFLEERNYDLFLKLFEKYLIPVSDLFAYCLLRNHFHLSVRIKSEEEILETKKTLRVSSNNSIKTLMVSTPNTRPDVQEPFPNPDDGSRGKPLGFENYASRQFSNFFNAYAKTINKAYGRTGSLFQHPFGRVPITTDRHYSPRSEAKWEFWNVIAYVHQNPQKHGFVKDFRDWKYSSYRLVLTSDRKPTFIKRDKVLQWFGTKEEYLSLHDQWVTDAQARWFSEDDFD